MMRSKNNIIVAIAWFTVKCAVANVVTNSFVIVEGQGVSISQDGNIILDKSTSSDIKVTARSGWLVNGRDSVSLSASRGGMLKVMSRLGEDEEHVHVYPSETKDVHSSDIILGVLPKSDNLIAMYALPDTSTVVSISAMHEATKRGKHKETTTYYPCVCGKTHNPQEVVRIYEVEPDGYEWTASGAGQTVKASTWTDQMSKGLRQSISFHVIGKRDECAACTCMATTNVVIDVHELSVTNDLYLGLDRTDFGRSNSVIKVATALIDPEPTGSSAYSWIECGICAFTGRTDRAQVRYFAPDPDKASTSYLAEPLTVRGTATNAEGLSASANCTTNFTVVKVDVALSNIGEAGDEISLPPVCYIADEDGGSLSKAWLRYLYPVSVTCMPMDVPGLVGVAIQVGAKLYEITESYDGVPMMAVLAQEAYLGCEIGQKRFGIHGHSLIGNAGDENLMAAVHRPSKAIDHALVKVVPPPPLEVSVQLNSPAEGGGWPYDPVWDDPEWALTVDGSLAKQCAEDTDEALVITTLSRDAQQVDGGIYEWGLIWDDKIISFQVDPSEGVHTNYWGMAPNLKASEYLAKVVAVEKETGDNRPAKSNTGEVERKPYYYSGAREVMELTKPHVVTRAEYDAAVSALNRGVTVLSALSVAPLSLIPGSVWVNIALGIGGGFGFSELYSNAMALPHWFQNGSRIYWTSWVVTRYDWDGSNYAILPNEIRLPDVGVDGMEKKSIFEMGYQKVIYLGDDGSTSTNAISYHSREYEWTNVQGKYWDVSSVWKWAPIPNSRYGLSEPKIMTK